MNKKSKMKENTCHHFCLWLSELIRFMSFTQKSVREEAAISQKTMEQFLPEKKRWDSAVQYVFSVPYTTW